MQGYFSGYPTRSHWQPQQPQLWPQQPCHVGNIWPRVVHFQNFQPGPHITQPHRRPFRQQTPINKTPSSEVQQYLDMNYNNGNKISTDINMNQKVKQHKNVPVEAAALYCVACEREFQNSATLNNHLKSHTQCLYPNCSFVASRKALKLHEIQFHKEGKLKIILNTPEEIVNWREARKRNYPTLENIRKKKELERQRIESGQTVVEKNFRYNKRQGWKQQRYNKKGRNNINRRMRDVQDDQPPSTKKRKGQQPDVEDVSSNHEIQQQKDVPTVKGALGALSSICTYGDSSSDNEDDDQTNDIVEKDSTDRPNELSSSTQCDRLKQGAKPKDSCQRNKKRKLNRKARQQPNENDNTNILPRWKRPNLLQMLLAPDIRHERNVLLQCIRHIVKKDFFGVGSDKT